MNTTVDSVLTKRHPIEDMSSIRIQNLNHLETHKLLYIPIFTDGSILPSMKRIGLNTSASSPQIDLILQIIKLHVYDEIKDKR